ncbi:hypothetical protein [Litorihabitans aurantiacus]|uniref:Uncharacterized protein n=1 Tax=Litorihabitans aurantiacus TaxID=1930061 RepID=A0AA37XFD2_9MICO|nr:hypothetical protein [Litorihabitans aurantiacus]GMA32178.1 hypothetical protein GCM10025875_21700 [Litorihabitans aurantiacus]
MTRATTGRIAAVAAAMALGLVACGSDDGGSGGGGELTYEDSPLMPYFTAGDSEEFDQEAMSAQYEEESARVEQLTAECMAGQGFEYTPQDFSGQISFGPEMDEDFDPIENARQNGYGFNAPQDPEQDEWVDANADYVESMSESERDAYYEALYGPSVEMDAEAEMETEWDWSTAGCSGEAQHQVYEVESDQAGTNDVYSDPRWEELMTAMSTTYEDVQNHPDMVALNEEWASCMADAGHSGFASSQEAQESIMDAQNAFWEENADDPEYMGPSEAETAELREREIELATADYTCQDETDYNDRQLRAQFAVEQEFVDENKAELEAFAEALAAAGQ